MKRQLGGADLSRLGSTAYTDGERLPICGTFLGAIECEHHFGLPYCWPAYDEAQDPSSQKSHRNACVRGRSKEGEDRVSAFGRQDAPSWHRHCATSARVATLLSAVRVSSDIDICIVFGTAAERMFHELECRWWSMTRLDFAARDSRTSRNELPECMVSGGWRRDVFRYTDRDSTSNDL